MSEHGVSDELITAVRRLTTPIGATGGMWMLHPDTIGSCKEWGYPNAYAYYIAGRGAVLGDVAADVITSAFAFFDTSLVTKMWTTGIEVEGAAATAARYRSACAEFGRVRLAGHPATERFAALAERVASGVDPSGLALFAGWRAEPLPDDAAARAFQLGHVLRELRGSVHIVACVAAGITPLQAVLAGDGGPVQAERFGWAGPFDEVDARLRAARDAAEELTDQILARLYGSVISADEAGQLADDANAIAATLLAG